jgi:excisionase family DNA binding protein
MGPDAPTQPDNSWAKLADDVAARVAEQLADRQPIRPEWLTPDEAARYLSLKPKTLEAYRHEGRGPSYRKIGNRIRYSTRELDRWVEGGGR